MVCIQVYVTVWCLSVPSVAAVYVGLLLWSDIDHSGECRSCMAHSSTTLSSRCDQCHAVSWCSKLNTDLLFIFCRQSSVQKHWPEHVCFVVWLARASLITWTVLISRRYVNSTACCVVLHSRLPMRTQWFRYASVVCHFCGGVLLIYSCKSLWRLCGYDRQPCSFVCKCTHFFVGYFW